MRTGEIRIHDGKTVTLSKVVLGTAEYGSAVPQNTALTLIDRYYEAGGRTIDTAREYLDFLPFGASQSERTIGKWLRASGLRKQMTIITKGGCPESRKAPVSRMDPKCIENDLMTSLAVMDLDYTDGFLLHKDDESVPVGEIMDTLDCFVKAGYVKFIGVSNWRTERIAQANAYARENGKTTLSVSEVYWNMAQVVPGCTGAPDNLPMTEESHAWYLENKMPVLAYSSQAVGFFAKYLAGQELQQPRAKMLLTEENIRRAERAKLLCEKYGVSPAALCIAYITSNAVDGYAIFGSSKLTQFMESLPAFDLELSQADINFLQNG